MRRFVGRSLMTLPILSLVFLLGWKLSIFSRAYERFEWKPALHALVIMAAIVGLFLLGTYLVDSEGSKGE